MMKCALIPMVALYNGTILAQSTIMGLVAIQWNDCSTEPIVVNHVAVNMEMEGFSFLFFPWAHTFFHFYSAAVTALDI